MIKEIERVPEISFIDGVSLDSIKAQLVADYQDKYQEVTGKAVTLKSGEPITLMLHACAVQFLQMYANLDKAGKMNFLKYAYGDFLDNLGVLKGVTRQDAVAASCTVRFTLSAIRPGTIAIPAGTRVTTQAANVYFATDDYSEIPSGSSFVDVPCTCLEAGTVGNGCGVGELSILVDPIAYIATVSNVSESGAGFERESDESFAERIYLATGTYSVAGPKAAYEYFVREAYSGVEDVVVTSPSANLIDIRVIGEGGTLLSPEACAHIVDYLNEANVKPMGDVVSISSPENHLYDIDVTYYINRSEASSISTLQAQIASAVSGYTEWQAGKIGRDIEPGQLIARLIQAGAKRVVVTSPTYTAIQAYELPKVGTITVTYGGLEDD